jgi:hypothetical protein
MLSIYCGHKCGAGKCIQQQRYYDAVCILSHNSYSEKETHNHTYSFIIGKSEVKRKVGRPGHRWEDNIKIDLREIRLEGVDWI